MKLWTVCHSNSIVMGFFVCVFGKEFSEAWTCKARVRNAMQKYRLLETGSNKFMLLQSEPCSGAYARSLSEQCMGCSYNFSPKVSQRSLNESSWCTYRCSHSHVSVLWFTLIVQWAVWRLSLTSVPLRSVQWTHAWNTVALKPPHPTLNRYKNFNWILKSQDLGSTFSDLCLCAIVGDHLHLFIYSQPRHRNQG